MVSSSTRLEKGSPIRLLKLQQCEFAVPLVLRLRQSMQPASRADTPLQHPNDQTAIRAECVLANR